MVNRRLCVLCSNSPFKKNGFLFYFCSVLLFAKCNTGKAGVLLLCHPVHAWSTPHIYCKAISTEPYSHRKDADFYQIIGLFLGGSLPEDSPLSGSK